MLIIKTNIVPVCLNALLEPALPGRHAKKENSVALFSGDINNDFVYIIEDLLYRTLKFIIAISLLTVSNK